MNKMDVKEIDERIAKLCQEEKDMALIKERLKIKDIEKNLIELKKEYEQKEALPADNWFSIVERKFSTMNETDQKRYIKLGNGNLIATF